MSIPSYSVLIGRAVDRKFATTSSNHYEIHVKAANVSYRIAVNVQSQDGSEVLYAGKDPFDAPFLAQVAALGDGRHPVVSQAGGVALDFQRGTIIQQSDMKPLPATSPGDANDLNDFLDALVQRAISDTNARLFAYGSFFHDNVKDKYFDFKPGQGIHDVHMNQGNDPAHKGDDGVWSDGALLFHFPGEDRWAAIFLAFQSQSWTTDAQGHATTTAPPTHPPAPTPSPTPTPTPTPTPVPVSTPMLRIVAAMPNSIQDPEVETVTLLNVSPAEVDLSGWVLSDRQNHRFALAGKLTSGDAVRVTIGAPMQLSNKGDKIVLLDPNGKTVDGVSYSKEQASKAGWTVVF